MMELNTRSRSKLIQLKPSDFLTKVPKTYIGEKTTSSINDVGKTRYPHVED
jgi:hypothetical protein